MNDGGTIQKITLNYQFLCIYMIFINTTSISTFNDQVKSGDPGLNAQSASSDCDAKWHSKYPRLQGAHYFFSSDIKMSM
jgi:hypothetical protein